MSFRAGSACQLKSSLSVRLHLPETIPSISYRNPSILSLNKKDDRSLHLLPSGQSWLDSAPRKDKKNKRYYLGHPPHPPYKNQPSFLIKKQYFLGEFFLFLLYLICRLTHTLLPETHIMNYYISGKVQVRRKGCEPSKLPYLPLLLLCLTYQP